MKNKLKKVLSLNPILTFIIGVVLASGTVYAATSLFASDVSFTSRKGLVSTNVQDAIDEVYSKTKKPLCKPATNVSSPLHEPTSTAQIGDAFDCDINYDGSYSGRFIFVGSNNETNTSTSDVSYYLMYEDSIDITEGPYFNGKFTTYLDSDDYYNYRGNNVKIGKISGVVMTTKQWKKLLDNNKNLVMQDDLKTLLIADSPDDFYTSNQALSNLLFPTFDKNKTKLALGACSDDGGEFIVPINSLVVTTFENSDISIEKNVKPIIILSKYDLGIKNYNTVY